MSATKKVVIVTGAGSGIGKASALALLREGWHVALAGRRKERLEQVTTEAGAASGTSSPSAAAMGPMRMRRTST